MAKWTLKHAIHKGTIASRDIAEPEGFDTQAEALEALEVYKRFYASMGYKIWYAYLTSPAGDEVKLESNNQY